MARPPRIDFPNAVYHVTSRGNARGVIFWSDDDRQRFLAQLADSLHTSGVQLYAFVLMKNHFHLLVKTSRANLSRFMQRLLTRYALYSRYCLGSGAVSTIHRKVQKDWQNILPIVNELALRLQGKCERKKR